MGAILAVSVGAAVLGGIVSGATSGLLLGRTASKKVVSRSRAPEIVVRAARIGALCAAIPSLFCSFVVGGNLGGSWGEVLLGPPGVPVGLFLGISLVLSIGVALATGAARCLEE